MSLYSFNSPRILELGEYIEGNHTLMASIKNKKPEIVKKWLPVIERGFDDIKLSDSILEDICLYCEVCSNYYDYMRQAGLKLTGNELAGILSEIKKNILVKEDVRSTVVGKVYNYRTGFMEYQLEDGNYVKIVGESVIGPRFEAPRDIFCEEFIKHIDISAYRDNRIDKLL